MKASYYTKLDSNRVQCELCPHNCIISKDKYGICKVRKNESGNLITKNYGVVSSIGFDPIEKKPLYHFYPGLEILSVGSLGCNLKCKFCQNWQISQTSVDDFIRESNFYNPEMIIDFALKKENNIGIAFTYNEPTVFFEFMIDTAKKSKEAGLKNVMVSNGYINEKPLQELLNYIDAFNIDLKAFSEHFFKEYTKSQLEPVKQTLKQIVKAGKHVEITNLVIPTLNDDEQEFSEMIDWIKQNLSDEVVMHISKYYPSHEMKIQATSIQKIIKLGNIAKTKLKYVYLGNIILPDANNTYCPQCNDLLITRSGYSTKIISINNEGNCIKCNHKVLNYIR